MSQPPYAGPPGPPAPPPPRRRPSGWWFAVGGVLLLLAPVVFVGGLLWTLRPLLSSDGSLSADGEVHRIAVPAHSRRALFRPEGSAPPSCRIADADGTPITPRPVAARYTTTVGGTSYSAYLEFDSGAGDLRVRCSMPATVAPVTMRVGPVPRTGQLVVGVLVSVVGPIVLGLAGLVVVVVAALLRSRRPDRSLP